MICTGTAIVCCATTEPRYLQVPVLRGNCHGFVIYDCLASWPLLHLDNSHLSFSQHWSISFPIIFFALPLIRATTPNMSQVKNLRAMFENKGDTSPPDRGRSPGISSTTYIEGKPLVVLSKLFSCFNLADCASLFLLWFGYDLYPPQHTAEFHHKVRNDMFEGPSACYPTGQF